MYLNCHTHFSFKYGILSPQDLIQEAKRCDVHKLVLTDINNTSGYIEMLRILEQELNGFALDVAMGIEFSDDQNQLLYIGIARDNDGFTELNRFLSQHNLSDTPLPKYPPEFDRVFLIYPWGTIEPAQLRENEYVGVRIHQINRILTSSFVKEIHKLVIHHPVTFKSKTGFNVHRLLRAVANNTLLSKLSAEQQAHGSEIMVPEQELMDHYRRYPEMIATSKRLLEQCHFKLDFNTDKNKRTFTGSRLNDHHLLKSLAYAGFERRYSHQFPREKKVAQDRLDKELEIISKRNFESYFLISDDIVQFARRKNFSHVGRGSGANSITAYCLGLTDVDPIELDLYFERFLNPERSSPPDFDIDFSWKDRDEVTRYIFDRHGIENTALLGTHTTFKDRSVLRELGKVFGLPKNEIDQIVKYPQYYHDKDGVTRLIFKYAQRLMHMPANLSIHAGRILITEEPIYAYTATDLPPKGYPTAHFEMHAAEDVGIYKFDILSQRGLGHIKDTVEIISKNRKSKVDISQFHEFKKDEKIKKLLRQGRTMGCFYVESPAMRQLLGKLGCDNYRTLVAASSIIRPGVARSGMMREYIHRHHHPGEFEYLHPLMGELLEETYGVMVYQEDVIKVAHHFAGLTLSEADILRRGMSGKFRSRAEFRRVEEQFFENCRERGYPEEITQRVWFEIESFSGYSFAKGHSASYAVESYQSLFLKAHYPLEFMVGVINNFGGFYKTEFYFHEARMEGAIIESPCVNHSDYTTNIYEKSIYIGFIHLKSLESKIAQLIPIERRQNGDYASLDNFIRRIPIGLEQMRILVRIGALRFTGKSKSELLWDVHLYFGKNNHDQSYYQAGNHDLFEEPIQEYELPALESVQFEDALDELELLGFSLCDPFNSLKTDKKPNTLAGQLKERLNQPIEMIGYHITTKNTMTKGGKSMYFGTFYDAAGIVFDTTHFPTSAKKYPFQGRGFYWLVGKVVEDFGYPMVEIFYMEKLPMLTPEEPNPKSKVNPAGRHSYPPLPGSTTEPTDSNEKSFGRYR